MESLLERYIKGEVSAEDRRRFMLWLDEDPAHWEEFRAMRKVYDISLWQSMERKEKKYFRLPLVRRLVIEVAKVAAVVAIVLLGVHYFEQPVEEEPLLMQSVRVPTGQRVELTLADGTDVWLNSRSTLRFPNRFEGEKRVVELDGEGFFSVEHNEKKPFIVETPHYDVQVLGTEFNVKAYSESKRFETSLIKGCVEISSQDQRQRLRLKPDQMASADGGPLNVYPIADSNYFKWREGLFCFENETVESLISKLQLYYDVHIQVENKELLKYHYSGKFRTKDGIEHVLRVLQLKHKFSYTKDDEHNEIIIK